MFIELCPSNQDRYNYATAAARRIAIKANNPFTLISISTRFKNRIFNGIVRYFNPRFNIRYRTRRLLYFSDLAQ